MSYCFHLTVILPIDKWSPLMTPMQSPDDANHHQPDHQQWHYKDEIENIAAEQYYWPTVPIRDQ